MYNSKPKNTDLHDPLSGVGARHRHNRHPLRGGGYLNNCTKSELCLEALHTEKLKDELRGLNLPAVWVALLDMVDPNQFVDIWRLFADQVKDDDKNYLYVPSINNYHRLQRDRLVLSLHQLGMSNSQIKTHMNGMFGEVSIKTIERIIKRI